ncbi:hypothetical protein [Streptomyces sp. NBC_01294]|nr:hypothetical protein [Streptomyces sp. NBC_01294]WRZ61478.1 hypothetical protein OG534_36315 [Streptomyces sp. NBC_01294]
MPGIVVMFSTTCAPSWSGAGTMGRSVRTYTPLRWTRRAAADAVG